MQRLTIRIPILLLALVLLAPAALAQGKDPSQYAIPDYSKIERETEKDAEGRLQWAKYLRKQHPCPTCRGAKKQECPFCFALEDYGTCPECRKKESAKKKEAVCRTCTGEGTLPDILEEAICPECKGASVVACLRCFGNGNIPMRGSERGLRCLPCKGKGHHKCTTCRGKRTVETPRLKPSVAEADLGDLERAMETLVEVEKALAAMKSQGRANKDAKLWEDALKPGVRYFPALRTMAKAAEDRTKDLGKGQTAVDQAGIVDRALQIQRAGVDLYLRQQKRLLELCIARAKHNATIE